MVAVTSPALSSDGKVVYVGIYDNNLYAVDTLTGSTIWSFATYNDVASSPALSSVYVGGDDYSLYAVVNNCYHQEIRSARGTCANVLTGYTCDCTPVVLVKIAVL